MAFNAQVVAPGMIYCSRQLPPATIVQHGMTGRQVRSLIAPNLPDIHHSRGHRGVQHRADCRLGHRLHAAGQWVERLELRGWKAQGVTCVLGGRSNSGYKGLDVHQLRTPGAGRHSGSGGGGGSSSSAAAVGQQQLRVVPSRAPGTNLTGGTKPAPTMGTLASVLVGSMLSAWRNRASEKEWHGSRAEAGQLGIWKEQYCCGGSRCCWSCSALNPKRHWQQSRSRQEEAAHAATHRLEWRPHPAQVQVSASHRPRAVDEAGAQRHAACR